MARYKKGIQVVIASGFHLYPFRTEKLNLTAPMVLRNSGRVGSCRIIRNRARREAAGSVSPRSIFSPGSPLNPLPGSLKRIRILFPSSIVEIDFYGEGNEQKFYLCVSSMILIIFVVWSG